jgi:hypothetical protein
LPFRRRERPLHERLAEEGGLGPTPREPEPLDPIPATNIPGYGVHAVRRWDAVVSAEAEELPGQQVHFVVLPDGTVVVEEDVPDESLVPLADAVETQLQPPYRAEAVRRGARVWAVAARGVEMVEMPDEVHGDELELGVHAGERTLVVDGLPASLRLPSLERIAAERGLKEYVIRAERVDGALWEVAVAPL